MMDRRTALRIINRAANNYALTEEILKKMISRENSDRLLSIGDLEMIDATAGEFGVRTNLRNNYLAAQKATPLECELHLTNRGRGGLECEEYFGRLESDDEEQGENLIDIFLYDMSCDRCIHYIPCEYFFLEPDLCGVDEAIKELETESRRLYDLKDKVLKIFGAAVIGFAELESGSGKYYKVFSMDGCRAMSPVTPEEQNAIENGEIELEKNANGNRTKIHCHISRKKVQSAEQYLLETIERERNRAVNTIRAFVELGELDSAGLWELIS